MRTDRRAICLRCLCRQPAARTCALCGHDQLADTADREGRAAVIERLEARGEKVRTDLSDPTLREGDGRFAGVAVQGALVALGVTFHFFGGWAALGVAALLGGLSVANLMWGAGGVARVVRYKEQPDFAYPEIGCVEANAAPRAIEALSKATQAFLQARMLLRSDGRATLAEARVVEGDVVRCEGPCEAEPAPATYREHRVVLVYRGTAAHPVVIRRAGA